MAGHNKWSKIKRKKGVNDQRKGKIFTRCGHEIAVAVREGGSADPNSNARLQIAIEKAKAVNMPNENIDRAIKRASGEGKGSEQSEITYEGYGPSGVAVLVEALTDNRNRTASEVRHAFNKHGGSLGESGCVAWMFDRKGVLSVPRDHIAEEQLMDVALEAGAEDINDAGDVWEITCEPRLLHSLREALTAVVPVEEAELQYIAKTKQVLDEETLEKVTKLLEVLEELDDVMSVSANFDFEEAEGA